MATDFLAGSMGEDARGGLGASGDIEGRKGQEMVMSRAVIGGSAVREVRRRSTFERRYTEDPRWR